MAYQDLLAAARQNPFGADYHSLRMAYAQSPDYHPYVNDSVNMNRLRDALRDENWPAALAAVEALLEFNYLDIEAHMAADYVHTRRNDEPKLRYHRAWATGLISAIASTGTGRDFDTAYIVLSIAEEYTMLQVLGLKMGQQALQEHNGHWFDVLDVQHPDSGALKLYFNIDLPHKWLSRNL